MKNSTISLLSLLITITFSTQSVSAQSLVGKWKGEDNGEVGVINFDKEGYVSFTVGGELVGGIGVSGASEEQDGICARAGLLAIGADDVEL